MSERSEPTSTTPRGDRRRAEILAAATTLFARDGFRGVSIASVASVVGLTEAGVLHHFPSKAKLLLAVLEERDREAARDAGGRSDRAGLRVFPSLEALVERNIETPELVSLFTVLVGEAAASDGHPAHEHFAERYRRIGGGVRDLLEMGKASGEIAAEVDCDIVARLLLAMMDGLQIQWLLDPDFDMARAFRTFCAAVSRDITARPS